MDAAGQPNGPSRWAWIRAGFITFCIIAAFTASVPLPGPVTDKGLKSDSGKDEIRRWVKVLDTIGYQTDPETLGQQVKVLSEKLQKGRKSLIKPLHPWWRITASWQGWGLFPSPNRRPHSLEMHGRVAGSEHWEPLYISHDSEHQWGAGLVHFRRVRAHYKPGSKQTKTFKYWVNWLARRAFDDHAHIQEFRVQFRRKHTVRPGQTPNFVSQLRFIETRDRDKLQ